VSPLRSSTDSPSEPTTSTAAPRVTSSDSAESSSFVSPPFGQVLDLAIAREMVYAVAFSPSGPVALGIWSTPVEHPQWKRDR
jgi:hypothetical protein